MLADFSEKQKIDFSSHRGIIDYQPTELTLKARAGTPIIEIQTLLSEQQQQLATDFPVYNDRTTLGGAISVGYTGSGRPYLGAIRDHILGASLINGAGEHVNFGGQVMKNVAGYDVSRLLAGSRGTLGPILDITVKVLPVPQQQITLYFEIEQQAAIQTMNELAGKAVPITASIYVDNKMYLRLEGTRAGISQAKKTLGGKLLNNSKSFWQSIQQQTHDFFKRDIPLWRIIVPAMTDELKLEHEYRSMIDWCGGLRWVSCDCLTQKDIMNIKAKGGYIESHGNSTATSPSDLMSPLILQMHKKIKTAFDPENIFNPQLSFL